MNGAVETCFGSSHRYAQYMNFLHPLIDAKFNPKACMGLWDELLWFGCLDKGEVHRRVSLLVEFGKIHFNIQPFWLIKILANNFYVDLCFKYLIWNKIN